MMITEYTSILPDGSQDRVERNANLGPQSQTPGSSSPGQPTRPLLLPAPQEMQMLAGEFELQDGMLIALVSPRPQQLRNSATRLQAALKELEVDWRQTASSAAPADRIGLKLVIEPDTGGGEQGYSLVIDTAGITASASTPPGIFYAVCTLVQIVKQHGKRLPCLNIRDWPDFPVRGVMLDISRDKVPTMKTLFELVDRLAGWKYNQLQLYTEHTFAYEGHPEVWACASPLTGQEVMELDAFCRARFIELVPNQNSFGHMHRWLKHPRYAPLGEVSEKFQAPWGGLEEPFSLCPTDPRSLALISSLYDELLPHFESKLVNVGCDETFDLGQGRSKDECDRRGIGPVYLDFLLQIHSDLKKRGITMMFWGDIINQHPELIGYLPRDMIALEWGYEADHQFQENTQRYQQAGIPFYVCPGTSSWCSLAGRTSNAIANLLSAAESGLQNGAQGYLVTDWGDNGHWQFLPVSYLGFAAGAGYSWALESNRGLDIPAALSLHAFDDPTGQMGQAAYDLGDVYRTLGIVWVNASPLDSVLRRTLEAAGSHPKIRSVRWEQVMAAIEAAEKKILAAQPRDDQPGLVQAEYLLTVRMMRHACRRAQLAIQVADGLVGDQELEQARLLNADMQEIIQSYQKLWLLRSRPGGLADSEARLEKCRLAYVELINKLDKTAEVAVQV
jgi:hexosaminidase